ncbi:MAG: hypothetical protein U1F36_01990 [Planctomycetota bacterium]
MSGGRLLLALWVVFVAAFACQHARSPFLRIEREVEVARVLAERHGLQPQDVMALRETCGVDIAGERLEALVAGFAADRPRLGDRLAAIAASGERPLVDGLLAQADGDVAKAEVALRPLPQAIIAVRYLAMRDRFTGRLR